MKKMPCLFEREFHGERKFTLLTTVTPGCEWVLRGRGEASRKRDGTACMVREGTLYKRYDAKVDPKTGGFRIPPKGAIPCDEPDAVTGHWPHWVAISPTEPNDVWHARAFEAVDRMLPDGTYELCGPHFQTNPEGFLHDQFIRHGAEVIGVDRTFDAIKSFLAEKPWEGLVFHDGQKYAKIRRADFGLDWPVKAP